MFTRPGAVAASSPRLAAAYPCAMTDHVLRVRGGFACEIPGVEFLESGVGVVGVENDVR